MGAPVVAVAEVAPPQPRPGEPVPGGCFWHGEEPPRPGDHLTCGECGHIYRTEHEWVSAVHQMCREMGWPVVDDSPMCPLCSHDL